MSNNLLVECNVAPPPLEGCSTHVRVLPMQKGAVKCEGSPVVPWPAIYYDHDCWGWRRPREQQHMQPVEGGADRSKYLLPAALGAKGAGQSGSSSLGGLEADCMTILYMYCSSSIDSHAPLDSFAIPNCSSRLPWTPPQSEREHCSPPLSSSHHSKGSQWSCHGAYNQQHCLPVLH